MKLQPKGSVRVNGLMESNTGVKWYHWWLEYYLPSQQTDNYLGQPLE